MNAPHEFELIERDLGRAVTDSAQAKRILSDALWRLGQKFLRSMHYPAVASCC